MRQRRRTNDATRLRSRFAVGSGQACQACCAMSITSGLPVIQGFCDRFTQADFAILIVAADPFSVSPPSGCSLLSPSLLTCLHHFVQVRSRPNLNRSESILKAWKL
jgi:hypothetical protein